MGAHVDAQPLLGNGPLMASEKPMKRELAMFMVQTIEVNVDDNMAHHL